MNPQVPQTRTPIYVTARVSFPNIVDPQSKVNEKGETTVSYNCDLIFPSHDPKFQEFLQVYARMAQEKWGDNANAAMQRIQADRRTRCYGQGEEKVNSKTFQVLDGYVGNVYIAARNSRQPQVMDAMGKPVDPSNTMAFRAIASKIYGGCYVNAVITPWLQQNDNGIGIRCELTAIQFNRDGEAFGAAPVDVTPFFGAVQGAQSAVPSVAQQGSPAQMPAAPFSGASQSAPAPGIPSFMQQS